MNLPDRETQVVADLERRRRDAIRRTFTRLDPLALGAGCAVASAVVGWVLPGRLLFPAAYLSILVAVAAAARRAGCSNRTALLFALACGVTPTFVESTSGGFDSGYADGVLAASLAATALGMTSRAPVFVAAVRFQDPPSSCHSYSTEPPFAATPVQLPRITAFGAHWSETLTDTDGVPGVP